MDPIFRINCIRNYLTHNYTAIPTERVTYTPLNSDSKATQKSANIIFHQQDTLETAAMYENPLILILADDERPGGTYISGMQEESLFRRTALFAHLTPDLYPIRSNEALVAKHVGVFSYAHENSLKDAIDFSKPLHIQGYNDFIACPGLKSYTGKAEDTVILANKIRLIMNVAVRDGYTTVILGALGCGVFGCDARRVAECFRNVLAEYNGQIENIVFAILGKNYTIFSENTSSKC